MLCTEQQKKSENVNIRFCHDKMNSPNFCQRCVLSFHCSIALVKFANRGDDEFILVGTVQELMLNPRSCSAGFIHVYQLTENGEKLEFVHRTQVDDVPAAIVSFQGRVLIGVGRYLRVYDLGKKKLLRKCENKVGGFTVGLCEVCGIDTF